MVDFFAYLTAILLFCVKIAFSCQLFFAYATSGTKCRMGGEKGGVPPKILIGLGLSEVMGGFGTYVNPQTHLY